MYRVSLDIFDRMKVDTILMSRLERNMERGGGGISAYPVSSKTLTIM